MKKALALWLLALPLCLLAQERHSWDGLSLPYNTKGRVLNLFLNVIYDVHPEKSDVESTTFWPEAHHAGINNEAIPSYLLDFMDTVYRPGELHGTMTRLYGEASFDTMQLTGDFVVVNVPESRVLKQYGTFGYNQIIKTAIDMINETGGLHTVYGHDHIDSYLRKGNVLYGVQIMIRNIRRAYGGTDIGCGFGDCGVSHPLLIDGEKYTMQKSTIQCVGAHNFAINPANIVSHEISHLLFGGNDFHASGGNHRAPACSMSFLNIQGGYGLMGAANSSLVCCNGYERWRMRWQHPEAAGTIAAHDVGNTHSLPSDISRDDGNLSFRLRDFLTWGDAIRIRLPYKDSTTSSNQYIWLENHQIGFNDKLDFFQYSNDSECRPSGRAGIYAYYQVGRDILSGTRSEVWDHFDRDNLKPITAEGFYDFSCEPDSFWHACVAFNTLNRAFVREKPNPFCGAQDQALFFFPNDEDTLLMTSAETTMWRKRVKGNNDDAIPFLGDMYDAFATHTRINMGTNPSTCNTPTRHATNRGIFIKEQNPHKDTHTIYLTGLGIEMVPLEDHDFLVHIRWDDYDITDDARWTGDIALMEMARLTSGHTITLAQNLTVAQTSRDRETHLFAPRTRLTCHNGSTFILDKKSTMRLTDNSSLVLENGSTFIVGDRAKLVLRPGCKLIVKEGAKLEVQGKGRVVKK